MKKVKVKIPAKINLTLEVLNKRPDGYHNIQSVMQLIDLYAKEGIPYINLSWSEAEEDAANCLAVMKKAGR